MKLLLFGMIDPGGDENSGIFDWSNKQLCRGITRLTFI